MDGTDEHGKRLRRSLKTRDWRRAGQVLDRIEGGAAPEPPTERRTLAAAVAAYLADCKARKLAESSITSYKKALDHLQQAFPGAALHALDVPALREFRQSREVTASTQTKEISTLRAFFAFCVAAKWIDGNPAQQIRPPKNEMLPTLPFTDEEIGRLLAACNEIDNPNKREIPRARLRARALVLLLLYSGFRISDAIKLERAALDMKTGRLMVRAMKTQVPMYIKLNQHAVDALKALPVKSPYFFWSGTAKLSTAIGSARRTVTCIVKLSNVTNGHPHRFRDTFSVALLNAGEDIRTVQLLLGHTSLRTTEKHYAPFVRTTQQRIENAVAKLHFGLPAQLPVDGSSDAGGNAKRNVLPLAPRKQRLSS